VEDESRQSGRISSTGFFVMTADLDSRSPIDSLVQDDG